MLSRLRSRLPLLGTVWRLALPVIASNLLISLVNVVDLFMAGRLGPLAIAAVGMATSVRMLVLIGIMSVTAGAMTLAAQAYGAKDRAVLSHVARQSLLLTVLLALLLSVVGWFAAEPLLGFLNSGGDPRATELSSSYLRILFLGTVLLALNLIVNSLLHGTGDTLTPLYITAGANVLNVLFNYLFMFGPGPLPAFGVAGAAMGTLAARFIASSVGLYILYSGRNAVHILPGRYRPDWGMFRDILAIGVPSGLQGMARNGAQLLLLGVVTSTAAGTYGAAALAIGLQIESLAFMPGLAVSVAATSLVGQALGAWDTEEARRRGSTAIFLGVVVMSAAAVPIFVFAPAILLLFDPSAHPTVLEAGTSYLRINALFLPLLGVAMVTNGSLCGAGDTRPGLVGTVVGRCLIVVPLAHLLALTLGLGVSGAWWALGIGTSIQALWVALRWRSGAWQRVALQQTKLYRRHLKGLPVGARRRFLDEVRAPLMAELGATEQVERGEVRYTLPDGEVVTRFRGGGFEIVAGGEWLELGPAPTTPTRAAPKVNYAHD